MIAGLLMNKAAASHMTMRRTMDISFLLFMNLSDN